MDLEEPSPCELCAAWIAAAEAYAWASVVAMGSGPSATSRPSGEGGRPSSLFGVPVPCCPVAALELSAVAVGPGASGNVSGGIYTDSKDRTRIGEGINAGGGASTLGISYNVGAGGKLGFARGGSSAFSNANVDVGFCVGEGASACFGLGFAQGGGWFEYSYGAGANAVGPLPVSFYGTGGYSWLEDIPHPW